MVSSKDDLDRVVKEESIDCRIACAVALAIAVRLGVAPREVGEACNRTGIKIYGCQLGCFG